MSREIAGAVAWVTGGASGIGAAVCRLLAGQGASVVVSDIDHERGSAVAAAVGGQFVQTDVRRRDDSVTAVAAAEQVYGRLDLVHLNAGLSTGGMTLDGFDAQAYRRLMEVNVDGVVYGLVAALPALRRSGGGAVVATSSLSGITSFPGDALYAASKHAVIGLVRSFAVPLAADGITVNAIAPGFTDTPLVGSLTDAFSAEGFPLLSAGEVAAVVLSLMAGEETGQVYALQPGRAVEPYRFRGVPGAGQPPPAEILTGEGLARAPAG
ncbi:MAG: SDR family oxidoreductase [Pseudonocardiales bacterium]